jgi:hypothetical protein
MASPGKVRLGQARHGMKGVIMVYQWKQERFKADAQKVGEELEKISVKDASTVVSMARKSKGELHKCFEWDDSIAGEEYRKEQARLVLRMIVTPVDIDNGKETIQVNVRAFESIRFETDEGSNEKNMTYVPIKEVLNDDAMIEQVISRLRNTIFEAEKTASTYEYLSPCFGSVKNKLHEAMEVLKK